MKHTARILIVEDEVLLAKAMAEKFTREGFETLIAKDGKEGLASALENHPDLIILDIIMPIMDGIEMLKKLRGDKWGEHAKVILATNLSDTEKIAEAVELSVFDYYIKADLEIDELVERVRKKLQAK